MAVYASMLTAYFISPLGRWLPLWTILDILLALALIYPVAKIGKNLFEDDAKRLAVSLILVSLVGTVTDSLTRVFLFVPAGLYNFFVGSPEGLYSIFVTGALGSYV